MRLPRFLRRRFWDEERSDELDSYLEIETADNIARGMSPEDARGAARKKLGNFTQIREEIYRMNTIALLESTFNDLRYAMRQLLRAPGFTVAAAVSLAFGIGANTAIFSAIDAVMLRSIPVERPAEIVQVQHWIVGYPPSWGWAVFPYAEFKAFREHNQVFVDAAAASRRTAMARIGADPEAGKGAYVSTNFYAMLGVQPFIGRLFSESDTAGSVVLHYGFWRRVYGGDPSAIGRTLVVDDKPAAIIGVAAPRFDGIDTGEPLDFAVANDLATGSSLKETRSGPNAPLFQIVGRLKPGVTIAQAAANLNVIYSPILLERGSKDAALGIPKRAQDWITVRPAASGIARVRDDYSRALLILIAIAAAVLLIACVNVANLLLARAAARRRELGVRLCLGAGRGRIISQMMTESLALCAMGGVAGVAIARWFAAGMRAMLASGRQPVELDLRLDWRVLMFSLAATMLASALVGVLPALRATRLRPADAVRGTTGAAESSVLRGGFTVLQVALSLVLVAGAGLFIATLRNLETLDAGLRRDHVVLAEIAPGRAGYDAAHLNEFYRAFLERVRQSPGVRAASLSRMTPMTGRQLAVPIRVAGSGPNAVAANEVSSGYFETMGTPFLAGRDFGPSDDPKVLHAIINESLVRRYFAGVNPVGRTITFGTSHAEIIGVVKDSKYTSLRNPIAPTLYINWMQTDVQNGEASVEVYASEDARAIAAVRQAVQALNPNVPVTGVTTFDRQIQASLVSERVMATISTLFGALALLMAAIGLYGVLAYSVMQRTREIGIRMALGAQRSRVISMVLRRVAAVTLIGVAIGTAAALALNRFVASMLYGVTPRDPWMLVTAIALLSVVALVAAYLPARRAAALDPMIALREE
jgi:predicted permease